MTNKKQPSPLPPILNEALSPEHNPSDLEEASAGELRKNCGICEGVACVEKRADNIYQNEDLNLKINIPAHVCSKCDSVIYEPEDYQRLLEAEEKAQGRHYVKVEIKSGKINKYSVH